MQLNKVKIGSFVELYNEICDIPNLTTNDVSGINRDKVFFEPSQQVGSDTSKYKIVPPNYFACNLMHVGRDIVLPIALNTTENNKIVSPAYTIFYITNEDLILKEYFYILLNSDEKDRYFWFNTDSSVRDGMDWKTFCDMEISIPPIEIQQKYVDIYMGLKENIESLEKEVFNLEKMNILSIIMNKRVKNKEKIGNLISIVEERNTNGLKDFYGININKEFMPTVANTDNLDEKKYKVVRKNRFVFSGMQTGRDKCIRISLYSKEEPIIVSPAYTTFEIINIDKILPEYFFMFFLSKEMDRYGWFLSDGSIRANLDWDRFCDIEIPMPDIEIQRKYVDIFKAKIYLKTELNRLKQIQKNICPILIKGSIEEAKGCEVAKVG